MSESSDFKLLSILRSDGPQSPASLMGTLGVSQPTLFRSVKAQPENIVALGASRNRKLAALRGVRGMNPVIPIFQVSAAGEADLLGNLVTLYPSASALQMKALPLKPQMYPGLPFFLDDVRPQGFLGRAFTQRYPDLRLPPRILDWNNDDILEAIARRGEDLTGNLLLGAESFERFQQMQRIAPEVVRVHSPEEDYLRYAQAALDGEPAGSSAGGEHPKFGATLQGAKGEFKKVLVKFSPLGKTFLAKRWRDLLICESLALETLRSHGISAAESRIVEAGGRTFLETVRFDRVGKLGRRGMVSLAAIENEWTGHGSNWSSSADLLLRKKKISPADLRTIQLLECFGRLIANSDRHSGNLSFFWQPGGETAVLAPVYDMLPMLYAPGSGGEDTGKIFILPTYDHTLLDAWKEARRMAMDYWDRVRRDTRISRGFREIAESNLKIVS